MELNRQSEVLGMEREALKQSDRYIITNSKTGNNLSVGSFLSRFYNYLTNLIEVDYSSADLFFTSAVYAFKAECDLPSVVSIIWHPRAIKMFRNPEKYDLFGCKKSRKVNEYFDKLFFE